MQYFSVFLGIVFHVFNLSYVHCVSTTVTVIHVPTFNDIIACDGEVINLVCPPGTHLKFDRAHYGRNDLAEQALIEQNHQSVDLEKLREYNTDGMQLMYENCHGEQTCDVPINPLYFGFSSMCPMDLRYFKASYACFPDDLNICESSDVTVVCPAGSKIKVLSSYYGVKDYSVCYHPDNVDNGICYNDNPHNAVSCDGQNTCTFVSANYHLETDPCVGTWKYLHVEYTCEI